MTCPKCSAANPDGKRFCGDCGVALDPIDEDFRRNVQAVIREQLKDQKLVEIETADAVILRLKTMAKPFLYTFALFVAVLGVLGFRSMRDVFTAVKNTQEQAVRELRAQAGNESKSLADEANTIRAQYRKLGDQQDLIAKLKDAEGQLKSIQTASHTLKQRYEELGTELATNTSRNSPERSAASISGEIGMRAPGPARTQASGPTVYAVGSTGPEVVRIQRRLHELGCYAGDATGEYDNVTKSAVSRFNEARGDVLGIGIVDASTLAALFTAKPNRCR